MILSLYYVRLRRQQFPCKHSISSHFRNVEKASDTRHPSLSMVFEGTEYTYVTQVGMAISCLFSTSGIFSPLHQLRTTVANGIPLDESLVR